MAGLANSDATSREAALRRVAIVLSSLPASAAAKLLGSIDQDAKQIVRRTMSTLSDVDPLERHRALIAFKTSVQKSPSPDIDSFQPSSRPRSESIASNAPTAPTTSPVLKPPRDTDSTTTMPLAFLADVDDDALVDLLAREHAQAVALVLASVAPPQAARLLPRLAPELRSSALSRLGRLGDIPEDAVREIAEHFRNQVRRQQQSNPVSDSPTTGQRVLDAILAAMPQTAPAAPLAPVAPSAPVNRTPINRTSVTPAPATAHAVDAAMAIRIAPETVAADAPPQSRQEPSLASKPERESNSSSQSSTPFPSTDSIHQHLISMKPNDLCIALGRVDTRTAMLTLCGLPNAKAEAVLAILPKAQSQSVRSQMNSLTSMNLRDIDLAKERVAVASLGNASLGHASAMAA